MNENICTETSMDAVLDQQLSAIIQDANDAIFHLRSGNSMEEVIAKAQSCAIRQKHLSSLVDQLKVREMKAIMKHREGVSL